MADTPANSCLLVRNLDQIEAGLIELPIDQVERKLGGYVRTALGRHAAIRQLLVDLAIMQRRALAAQVCDELNAACATKVRT